MQKILSRFLAHFFLALLLSTLIFSSGFDNYFASDDWPAIWRNSTFSWTQAPAWFTTLRAGWYRPIHDIFIHLCWRFFQLNPLGYRIISIILYALVTAHVGLLTDTLTKDRRISLVAVLLFTIFAPHAEPVLWFAGTNELLAGLFVLISVISYIWSRETNQKGLLIISGISSLLAFASKETALFFPILLLTYDWLLFIEKKPEKRHYSFFFHLIPLLLLWIGFLWFRIPLGSSYSDVFTISLLGMTKNFVYYLLIGLFALPNNYAFLNAIPLWRAFPLLPVVAVTVSGVSLAMLGWIWSRTKLLSNTKYKKGALLMAVWSISALGPVIFIVTERAVFLSTIGIVIFLSILIVGALDEAKNRPPWLRNTIAILILSYFCLNSFVLIYRSGWYEKSAELNQTILEQLNQELKNLPPNSKIIIANLPDHTQYTFTFRNTFPSATKLLQYPVEVVPLFDFDLAAQQTQQQDDYVKQFAQQANIDFVYWYRDGKLLQD